jgi:hypothetical protein
VTGCIAISTKHALSGGFYIKSTHYFLQSEPGGRSRLYYEAPHLNKVVWNYADDAAIHDGIAVFIGDWDGDKEYSGYCYFAVKRDGNVVRLRRLILAHAAQQRGAQLAEFMKRYGDYEMNEKSGGIQFEFVSHGVNQPHLFVDLTWDEIGDMVDTLVKTGKPHKDKLNGIVYLE